MADDKKSKDEKPEKKHAKGEGPPTPPAAGEKKPKKGAKEKKGPATIQAAQGEAHAKGERAARLRLALRGLDGRGPLLLLAAPLLAASAALLRLAVRLGVGHRTFAMSVLLRLVFLLLLVVCHGRLPQA